jgi:hypothetical protein
MFSSSDSSFGTNIVKGSGVWRRLTQVLLKAVKTNTERHRNLVIIADTKGGDGWMDAATEVFGYVYGSQSPAAASIPLTLYRAALRVTGNCS